MQRNWNAAYVFLDGKEYFNVEEYCTSEDGYVSLPEKQELALFDT